MKPILQESLCGDFMGDGKLHVLIVEQEYLIALDLERIVTEQFDSDVTIVAPTALDLLPASKTFGLVIMDAGETTIESHARLADLGSPDTAFIFTTTDMQPVDDAGAFSMWPVVGKPFRNDDIETAITAALAIATRNAGTP